MKSINREEREMEITEITKELTQFNTTDAAIAKLREDYMKLTIKGLDDRVGFDLVHVARMDVKKRRVQVTKRGEELRSDAVKFSKKVIEEQKRIIGLMQPIEDHLDQEETRIEEEKERIKAEAEAKIQAAIQARQNVLYSLGCRFDGKEYSRNNLIITQEQVNTIPDERFQVFVSTAQEHIAEELRVQEAERKSREDEVARLAKIAREQEEERKRLEEISRKQAEELARMKADQETALRKAREDQERVAQEQAAREAQIKAEREAIESEKQKLIDAEKKRLQDIEDAKRKVEEDRIRTEEMEKAKKEAAEKALKDAEEKSKKDAAEKAAKEEAARIRAEKKEARRPDKEKLLQYADYINGVPVPPDLKTQEAQNLAVSTKLNLSLLVKSLKEAVEEL